MSDLFGNLRIEATSSRSNIEARVNHGRNKSENYSSTKARECLPMLFPGQGEGRGGERISTQNPLPYYVAEQIHDLRISWFSGSKLAMLNVVIGVTCEMFESAVRPAKGWGRIPHLRSLQWKRFCDTKRVLVRGCSQWFSIAAYKKRSGHISNSLFFGYRYQTIPK